MEKIVQISFIHVTVVLPDKRILLRRSCYSDNQKVSKWSATIEKFLPRACDQNSIITKMLVNNLGLPSTKYIIRPVNRTIIPNYNRVIFSHVVEIEQTLTLTSSINYQFSAKPFSTLLDDITKSIIIGNYNAKYTINTTHIIKEAHLKGILNYAPIRKLL